MFGLEFMEGAFTLSLVHTVITLLIFGSASLSAYMFYKGKRKWVSVMCAILAVIFLGLALDSAKQPKIFIDTGVNHALEEYKRGDGETVIKTPEPRTEYMDGFEPLKN